MTLYERNGDDIDIGLVAYWKYNDLKAGPGTIIVDQALDFNNGTLTGGTVTTGPKGSDYALALDGSTDLDFSSPSNLDQRIQATISAWIKFDTLDPAGAFPSLITMNNGGGTRKGLGSFYFNAGDTIFFEIQNNGTQVVSFATAKSDWIVGVWYHIAIVWDSTARPYTATWYVNGVVNSQSTDTDVPDGITPATRGGDSWEGAFANMRIYNKALTQAQVNKLYRLKL